MFTIAWKELYSVSSPTSNLSLYPYVFKDFIQAVKAKRNGKPEIRIQKPEPENSFISRNILTTAKMLKKKGILIHAYDKNGLYWMKINYFSYFFFPNV
jgi:hypothetical protein